MRRAHSSNHPMWMSMKVSSSGGVHSEAEAPQQTSEPSSRSAQVSEWPLPMAIRLVSGPLVGVGVAVDGAGVVAAAAGAAVDVAVAAGGTVVAVGVTGFGVGNAVVVGDEGVAVGVTVVAVGVAVGAGGTVVAVGVTGFGVGNAVAVGGTVVAVGGTGVADEGTDVAVECGARVAVGTALTTLTGVVAGSIAVGSPHAANNRAIRHPIVPSPTSLTFTKPSLTLNPPTTVPRRLGLGLPVRLDHRPIRPRTDLKRILQPATSAL